MSGSLRDLAPGALVTRMYWVTSSENHQSPQVATEQYALKIAWAMLREVQVAVECTLWCEFLLPDGALLSVPAEVTTYAHANQARRRLETVIIEDARAIAILEPTTRPAFDDTDDFPPLPSEEAHRDAE